MQTLKDVKKVLQAQLGEIVCHITALQETRAQHASTIQGADFFEFHSAADRGDGGMALLFSRKKPYGRSPAGNLFFAREHFSCFIAGPRLLGVRIQAPFFQATVIAAHAPHSGRSASVIKQWWRDLHAQIPATPTDELFVLVDSNARLGSVPTEHVGVHAAQDECPGGSCLRDFLELRSLWAPATFFDSHGRCVPQAREPTWVSPNGPASRIDYILLPMALRGADVVPWVDHTIELPRTHDDHFPVCVRTQWERFGAPPAPRWPQVPRDPAALTAEQLGALQLTWQTLALPAWSVDVHQHTQYIFDHLRTCLPLLAVRNPVRRRPFLSDFSFLLIRFGRALKTHVAFVDKQCRRLFLQTVFAAWAGRNGPICNNLGWRLKDCHVILSLCVHTLHLTRGTLRMNVKADKAAFVTRQVQALQAQGLSHDHKAWYHALRPLRPPSKRIFKPWSRLTLHSSANASLPDRTAIADAKAHFFSAIEAGCAATADELVAHASQRAVEPGPFALADLPSLLQVENLTRRLASSKAPGPSKIPNFFWTLSPVRTAQHLLPLFVKCHVRLSEPMQFKDVDLVTLFKQKGAFSELSNHRAICLLEAPGKLFRKQTRQALLEALPNDDTHQGGMPGSLLQAGQHIVRACANCARAQGLSHAALFFDVSSAYYRVIRQAFCELGTTDRALLTILHIG